MRMIKIINIQFCFAENELKVSPNHVASYSSTHTHRKNVDKIFVEERNITFLKGKFQNHFLDWDAVHLLSVGESFANEIQAFQKYDTNLEKIAK